MVGLCNYFAAPFGSEEYVFLASGIEGVHHTVNDDGSRTLTEQGQEEIFNPSLGGLNLLYDTNREQIQYVQNLMADYTALGVNDPTANLFSQTAISKAAELDQFYYDRMFAIGIGRDPLDAVDDMIADWKSRGGDEIRREYEEAYARAQE